MKSPEPPSSCPPALDLLYGLEWRLSDLGAREADCGPRDPFAVASALRALNPDSSYAVDEREGAWFVVEIPPDEPEPESEPPKIFEPPALFAVSFKIMGIGARAVCNQVLLGPSIEYLENFASWLQLCGSIVFIWHFGQIHEIVPADGDNRLVHDSIQADNEARVTWAVGEVVTQLRNVGIKLPWADNTELAKTLALTFGDVRGNEPQ